MIHGKEQRWGSVFISHKWNHPCWRWCRYIDAVVGITVNSKRHTTYFQLPTFPTEKLNTSLTFVHSVQMQTKYFQHTKHIALQHQLTQIQNTMAKFNQMNELSIKWHWNGSPIVMGVFSPSFASFVSLAYSSNMLIGTIVMGLPGPRWACAFARLEPDADTTNSPCLSIVTWRY